MNGGPAEFEPTLSIAVITPARNERNNLVGVLGTLSKQRLRPNLWVIMDDASTDGTYELASRLAEENEWIRVWKTNSLGNWSDRSFTAFRSGTEVLSEAYDLLVKLDADTRLPSSYFEIIANRFREHAQLGIAGGVNASEWNMGHHIRGNNRVYLRECWKSLDLPDNGIGWDTIDIIIARENGWRTELFTDLVCSHLRGRFREVNYSLRLGRISRHLGYYPWYAFGRAVLIMVKQGAIPAGSYLFGYLLDGGGVADPRFRRIIRADQLKRMRMFP